MYSSNMNIQLQYILPPIVQTQWDHNKNKIQKTMRSYIMDSVMAFCPGCISAHLVVLRKSQGCSVPLHCHWPLFFALLNSENQAVNYSNNIWMIQLTFLCVAKHIWNHMWPGSKLMLQAIYQSFISDQREVAKKIRLLNQNST